MKKKFELANLSKSLLYCVCFSICALNLTACDDDDENGTQGNGPAPIGIPSSVVDGVRATSMSGVDVTYNEDGTIKEAEVDGNTLVFNYASSRAIKVDPIRSLISITSSERESERWIASDFAFNTSGFVTAYKLKYTDTDPDFREEMNIAYTFNYNADGQMQKISMKVDGKDDEGSYSESGEINYTYNNKVLEKIEAKSKNITCSQTYEYTQAIKNTYNAMPLLLLPEALASDDCVFNVFAITGYLGNAGANLPTAMTIKNTDLEDPSENSTERYNLSYTLNENKAISSYTLSGYGETMTFPCDWTNF
ncbi:DUF4595 domain-containing protein [Bacteroides stercoris]|jgi:hypothetical protein|uniref:DUF4595 domain-containing protein n=1 Tax=Bacteroides TaxID=816 RepID=UPI00232F704D|nr:MULTISPECIES: DUF4595 domain-containing protein [Bacteroides]MDC2283257.1 DUF4595 domain-containing protein [Bacteroides stercoris]MDC2296911.1 DUF4595 domain-containing protein [Bacteroides stercoris]